VSHSGSVDQLRARLELVDRFATETVTPLAEAFASAFDVYGAGIGAAELMAKLDILRTRRDAILDQTATLEVELESALDDARYARERLDSCRRINSPDWRP
jgi:hypothetical protein